MARSRFCALVKLQNPWNIWNQGEHTVSNERGGIHRSEYKSEKHLEKGKTYPKLATKNQQKIILIGIWILAFFWLFVLKGNPHVSRPAEVGLQDQLLNIVVEKAFLRSRPTVERVFRGKFESKIRCQALNLCES